MASDRNLRNYQDLPTIKILLSTILHFSTILMLFIYLLVLTSYQTQGSACLNLKKSYRDHGRRWRKHSQQLSKSVLWDLPSAQETPERTSLAKIFLHLWGNERGIGKAHSKGVGDINFILSNLNLSTMPCPPEEDSVKRWVNYSFNLSLIYIPNSCPFNKGMNLNSEHGNSLNSQEVFASISCYFPVLNQLSHNKNHKADSFEISLLQ